MCDFDCNIDRTGTASFKWDMRKEIFGTENVIPLWVADCDFKVSNNILNALQKKLDHGVFGYTFKDNVYFQNIINWMYKKNNWKIKKEWILGFDAIVPAIKVIINSLTNPGENILITSPVYYPFFDSINNNGRKVIESELIETDGFYSFNYKDFETKIIENNVNLFILCNPHNPVGRVWKKEELNKIAKICLKHQVIILSDEIHCDIIMPNNFHIPIASLSEKISESTITCTSPSKGFNLAGLQNANVIISNKNLRNKIIHTQDSSYGNLNNIFGIEACKAAYSGSEKWLEGFLNYINENYKYVKKSLESNLNVKVSPLEGTYLVWINFKKIGNEDLINKRLIEEGKIGLEKGSIFGKNGTGFFRMNIATQKNILEKVCNTIIELFQ